MNIKFEKATTKYEKEIFQWLEEDHMKEFWDNSEAHREDIKIFIEGHTRPSSYFGVMNTYWVGFIDGNPYSFIITHEESEDTDPPESYKPYLSKIGKTFGLDFGIGNKKYLGKGLAAPTLVAFMEFFVKYVEPEAETFLIDPFLNNPRAIHVYQKAGFEPMCEFEQKGGYFDGSKGVIMVRRVIG